MRDASEEHDSPKKRSPQGTLCRGSAGEAVALLDPCGASLLCSYSSPCCRPRLGHGYGVENNPTWCPLQPVAESSRLPERKRGPGTAYIDRATPCWLTSQYLLDMLLSVLMHTRSPAPQKCAFPFLVEDKVGRGKMIRQSGPSNIGSS